MEKIKTYGNPPYKVVLIGGTPGVSGELDKLSENLDRVSGILYATLVAPSVAEQLEELYKEIQTSCEFPCVLIAYDENAWIAILFASAFPDVVSKLILIGCPPLEDIYVIDPEPMRQKQLSDPEYKNYLSLENTLQKTGTQSDIALLQLIRIRRRTDGFNTSQTQEPEWKANADVFRRIHRELVQTRTDGKLVLAINDLSMPVVAFHGESDPYPVKGVRMPFVQRLPHYVHCSLAPCGHTPWIEKEEDVTKRFFYLLNREIKSGIKSPSKEEKDGKNPF